MLKPGTEKWEMRNGWKWNSFTAEHSSFVIEGVGTDFLTTLVAEVAVTAVLLFYNSIAKKL